MEGFQKTVLGIAIVFLILSLIFIGSTLKNAKNNQTWPPITGDCPDYWIDLSGNGSACFNSKNLGHCNNHADGKQDNTMDFTTSAFTGTDGTCNKKKWANKCSDPDSPVTWDGITYGVVDPCESTTTTTTTTTTA
jgi:hypothetical protein